MIVSIRSATAALVAALVAGCNDDSLGPTEAAGAAAGVYALATVNGMELPATLDNLSFGTVIVVKAGSMTIGEDRKYTFVNDYDDIVAGVSTPVTQTCTGTWTKVGNVFTSVRAETGNCGVGFTIVWDGGNRLTMGAIASIQMVFQRQP